jgi:hypothetical protein
LVEVKIENGEVTDLTAITDAAKTFTSNGLAAPNTTGVQRLGLSPSSDIGGQVKAIGDGD